MRGIDGSPGADGRPGQDGTDGILISLGAEGSFTGTLPVQGAILPPVCRTESYTAGENEVAIIHVTTSIAYEPRDVLVVGVAAAIDGNEEFLSTERLSAEPGPIVGLAHVASNKRVDLIPGATYEFGPGIAALFLTGQPLAIQQGRCNTSVVVARD